MGFALNASDTSVNDSDLIGDLPRRRIGPDPFSSALAGPA